MVRTTLGSHRELSKTQEVTSTPHHWISILVWSGRWVFSWKSFTNGYDGYAYPFKNCLLGIFTQLISSMLITVVRKKGDFSDQVWYETQNLIMLSWLLGRTNLQLIPIQQSLASVISHDELTRTATYEKSTVTFISILQMKTLRPGEVNNTPQGTKLVRGKARIKSRPLESRVWTLDSMIYWFTQALSRAACSGNLHE